VAALVRRLGDFDLAEELVQEAVLAALVAWPVSGIPANPGAWLLTAARRRGVDRLRRAARYRDKLALLGSSLEAEVRPESDDRLRLIFTCCHPSLSREAQLALTLRAVIGLSTGEVARAFLLSEAAMAQRIVRAKRKIVEAAIPYRVPSGPELGERLDGVLGVLYLMFNEGYLSSASVPERRDLARDAEWLASLLVGLLPEEPEALGLLALIRLHLARAAARFDSSGRLVLLRDQDRSLWDHPAIAAAAALVVKAGRMRRPGPYQVQAAIAAVHAESPSWEETDWRQIVALYGLLLAHSDTPVVRLNRAIALAQVAGPAAALKEVDALGSELSGYHLFHATRAELLRGLGRPADARAADARALELTSNPAERALLESRLA